MPRYEPMLLDETALHPDDRAYPRLGIEKLLRRYGKVGWQIVSFSTNHQFSEFYCLLQRELPTGDQDGE